MQIYKRYLKRLFDFCGALCAIVVLSPIFIISALLLLLSNGPRGVFFFQKRPGYHSEIFRIIKFKTMNDKKDEHGCLLPDNERITKIGNFIRQTSIDELPQILNVLKGDMSFIGPRPLLVQYLNLYTPEQIHRHDVRPGITGWAQVNGRNSISWSKKFEYDLFYVENVSFTLDLKIFFATIKKIFLKEGINQNSETTMEGFNGHN